MKSLILVLVLFVSLSSASQKAASIEVDICDMRGKAQEVLSAFKSESNLEDVQKFLVAFESALAKQTEGLFEAETLKNWEKFKHLESDKEDSKYLRELAKPLNGGGNDEYARGYLYNLCGLTPEVAAIVGKMKKENQALIKELFETLRTKVNEYIPGVFEAVKNGNSDLVEKIVNVEPAGFKGLSRMLGSPFNRVEQEKEIASDDDHNEKKHEQQ